MEKKPFKLDFISFLLGLLTFEIISFLYKLIFK